MTGKQHGMCIADEVFHIVFDRDERLWQDVLQSTHGIGWGDRYMPAGFRTSSLPARTLTMSRNRQSPVPDVIKRAFTPPIFNDRLMALSTLSNTAVETPHVTCVSQPALSHAKM